MECVGSIDQGTQSTRFFLYDKDCTPLASSQVPLPQAYPKAGWVEQDPLQILSTIHAAVSDTIRQVEERHGAVVIRSIGITNQRETTVVWDKATGVPLYNAIVWLDGRTAQVCSRMAEQHGGRDAFRAVTGLPVSTYFSAYKLKWLLENVPKVSEAAQQGQCMFGTIDSWIIYKLTGGGVHATDVTNASRTSLMNIHTLSWSQDMLKAFNVDSVILPEIRSNAEVFGVISDPLVPALEGIPIAGCLGDQQAAMLGQRCVEREAKNTYGTGCFMLLNTGPTIVASSHGLLTTVAYKLGKDSQACYALEGSIAIAGQGISWLRDSLGLIHDASESETVAGSVAHTGGVYFVPAFNGLLAPWWEPEARGTIVGITQYTTKAHIVRALLEAICFQTRDVLEAMKEDADMSSLACLFVDGGASQNNLLMQLQADVLQVAVRRPIHMETTSLGAALAAGIGIGFWSVKEAFTDLKHATGGTVFEPNISRNDADGRYAKWKLAVQRSLGLASLDEGLNQATG